MRATDQNRLVRRFVSRSVLDATVMLFLFLPIQAHPPTGIVVDQEGIVYFTDLETVWKLDTNGKLSIFRSGVSGRHVHELAIDRHNNLLGADISYESQKWISDVWKITPNGRFTYLLAPTSNPPRGFSMWSDAAGNMYLVEQDNHLRKQTLLLRRTPDGQVSTLAGSTYGTRDGKGTAASFGSIGGMFIANDGTIYLTDGTSVRKVTSDGVVTTVATDLSKRTTEDRPLLFGKNDGIVTGLSVDANRNIYLADAGNQRLLKINSAGEVDVVYRGDSPYYPNGVATTASGDLYVLEVGFNPPSTWLPARVRKITSAGKSSIIAVSGEQTDSKSSSSANLKQNAVEFQLLNKYFFSLIVVGVLLIAAWKLRRGTKPA